MSDNAECAGCADHQTPAFLGRSAEDDAEAVYEFARQFARTSGDSPTCQCVSCRAYRAVQAYLTTPGADQ